MRIAVCPGSFDPITNGHLDLIKRDSKLFDKVIVVVMINFHKPNSYFTASERTELILRSLPADVTNCEVDMYGGLLAEYCKKRGACAVVKGLRAVSDFEYEFQQALTNKYLNPELETIFMTTDQNNMFLSSSLVKQVCEFGGDVSGFLPEPVSEDIIRRIKERSSIV